MCRCSPEIRRAFCGAPGCEGPRYRARLRGYAWEVLDRDNGDEVVKLFRFATGAGEEHARAAALLHAKRRNDAAP